MEDKVKQLMSDILDLDVNSIDESTSRNNTSTWNSLNHVNLLVALEEEFSVAFDPAELELMVSFMDILEILDRRLAAR